MQYRGRPFSVSRLPIGPALRDRIEAWAAVGDADTGAALADELAEAMRAPVAFEGRISRPAG